MQILKFYQANTPAFFYVIPGYYAPPFLFGFRLYFNYKSKISFSRFFISASSAFKVCSNIFDCFLSPSTV